MQDTPTNVVFYIINFTKYGMIIFLKLNDCEGNRRAELLGITSATASFVAMISKLERIVLSVKLGSQNKQIRYHLPKQYK